MGVHHKIYNQDGSLERYKVKLVANGHTQIYGVAYSQTFSLVAKMGSIRLILALVVHYG